MESPILKVAVIGTGTIGKRHLNCLQTISNVETIAISKREANFGLLKNSSHCIIASNTACHVEDALRALDEGCHLLIEKPLATCMEEVFPFVAKVKEKKVKILVGCVLRFSESLSHFRQLLPKIGHVYSVRIECQSYLPDWRPDRPYKDSYSARANEGGVLRDLIHEIDYAGWIFGWPQSLSARLKNTGLLGIEAEEIADLWWESPKGAMVSITLDYLTRPSRRKMTACGENGTLEWDGIENRVVLTIAGEAPKVFQSKQSHDEMYSEQLKTFLEIRSGQYKPATFEEGLKALTICDASRVASDKQQNVPIPYLI